MTSNPDERRVDRVWAIADRAGELARAERASYLDEVCGDDAELRGEVEWLLEGVDELAASGQLRELEQDGPDEDWRIPERIGPYRILDLLGSGGQGVVYEAEQRSPRRAVALKVLKVTRGDRQHHTRLFRREIRALARLKHPSIATIHESGQTPEGDCFFTMELVEGESLDRYVRLRRPTLRQALALFLEIGEAVRHAHEKGVIHRDLKPSNILVDDTGRPKVLDFGLARLNDTEPECASVDTRTAHVQGTLPYMSPEQVGARSDEVDERSDVYSLGVILYEILTGAKPLSLERKSLHEAVRLVAEGAPVPPSRHVRGLAGDLETILLVALEKDPRRRYPDVAEMSADLRRYLDREPIRARVPNLAYRLVKFAHRNAVLTASVVSFLVLLAVSAVVAASQAERIEAERGRVLEAEREGRLAREEAAERDRRVRAMQGFAKGLLASANPDVLGPDMDVRGMVDDAALRLDELFAEDPAGESELRMSVAEAYRYLSEPARAIPHLRRAVELVCRVGGDGTEILRPLDELGVTYLEIGERAEGERIFRQTLELREGLPDGGGLALSDNLIHLSQSLADTGRDEEREWLARDALCVRQEMLEGPHPSIATAEIHLADVLRARGKLREAKAFCDVALEACRELDRPLATSRALTCLSDVLWDLHDRCGALDAAHEAYSIDKRHLGEDHVRTREAWARVARAPES